MTLRKPSLRDVAQVTARASLETLNIGVAGASLVGAAALHSWPVLALGAAAYVALVAWDVATPDFWKKIRTPQVSLRKRVALPELTSLTVPEARAAIQQLAIARAELDRVMENAPETIQGYATWVFSTLPETEAHAVTLAGRLNDLGRYLASADDRSIRASGERLREQATATSDSQARGQYEEAAHAREEQVLTLEQLGQARERVEANLSRVVATLQALPGKLLRMQVLDAQAMDALSGDMNRELDRMNAEVYAFEETLQTLSTEGVRA